MPQTLENPFTKEADKPKKRLFGGGEKPKRKLGNKSEKRIKRAKEFGTIEYGEHKIRENQVEFLIALEKELLKTRQREGREVNEENVREALLHIFDNRNRIQTDDKGNIITLNLLNLKINELPKEIKYLRKLDTLNCSQTGIKKFPPEIGKLKKLTNILCVNGKLEELPKEISDLKNLEALTLRDNILSTIPYEIAEMENLRIIDLMGNNIERSERKKIMELFEDLKYELKI